MDGWMDGWMDDDDDDDDDDKIDNVCVFFLFFLNMFYPDFLLI